MAVWSSIFISKSIAEKRIDGEYFTPEALQVEESILSCPHERLFSLSKKITDFGAYSQMNNVNYSKVGRHRFIRNQDIKGFYLDYNDNVMISEDVYDNLSLHLNKDDILVQRTGSIGKAGIVLEKDLPATANQNLAQIIVNDEKLNPFYLITYFNSKFGIKSFERLQTGNVQPWLNLKQIGNLKIPYFYRNIQNQIGDIAKEGITSYFSSLGLYQSAQQLLESELGLDKLNFQKPIVYTAQISEAVTGGRFDADYFQIPFRQIQKHLDTLDTVPLLQLANIIKGIEVGSKAYTSSGRLFLRVSNIKEKGIELGASDKYISSEQFALLNAYQPQIGELLLTKDGTPGVCFAVDEKVNGIISGGIVRLLPRRIDIPNEYLALVINSRACRMQVEQDCSGALILHWKPSSIRKLRIPLLPKEKMLEIANLVSKSKQAKRESEQLLEQAKTRVEQLIEDAVQS